MRWNWTTRGSKYSVSIIFVILQVKCYPFLSNSLTFTDVLKVVIMTVELLLCRLMFTTFNSDVRIWNLEKFAPFGRLSAATHGSRQHTLTIQIILQSLLSFENFQMWI